MSTPEWQVVRQQAQGERTNYRLDRAPLAEPGGQGEVFRAIHKPSGVPVAMKRALSRTEDALARMRREIDVARALEGHRRVMPVLDASPEGEWFVMPLAKATAADRHAQLQADEPLRRLITALCGGLAAAHEVGWVHRDIKPENILLLDKRWVVADWGLGRRPRGETTVDGRTRTGVFIGSERFSAPELAGDAHEATYAADVYSVGQIIGWAVTGQLPLPFRPLIPGSGPWRGVVRAATQPDPSRRPLSIAALLELIESELDEPAVLPSDAGEQLLARVQSGESTAATDLWRLAGRESDDYDLYIDVLPEIGLDLIQKLTSREPDLTLEVVAAMHRHLDETGSRNLPFSRADAVVRLLLAICQRAGTDANWALLEDAADAMFAWDAAWDQWNARDAIGRWLVQLVDEPARVVAAPLRRRHESLAHFGSLTEDRRLNRRLRAILMGR